jgi:hypothetical protein
MSGLFKMAIIEGQIEPLKKLKAILHQNKITRFGSVGEINDFIKTHETEKNEIPKVIEHELDSEINEIQIDLAKYQNEYEALKEDVTKETNLKITELETKLKLTIEKRNKGFIHKVFYYPQTKNIRNKKKDLEKNFENIVRKRTYHAEKLTTELKEKLEYYTTNREIVISERCQKLYQELKRTKEVVDSLYNLIAGAIGENSVIKEVQKLSDNFHLFNDFSVRFDPPIYNKKEDDRIYSIQIDHLLVCEAGVFILETKNWGKQSVKRIDLRSPVEQMLRSSYAFFVLLNSQSGHNINLEQHHWGSKQIPIRNIIVMTNAKPKEKFKHVKVLSPEELNGYVTYFDPIFNNIEIESICDYLRMRMR